MKLCDIVQLTSTELDILSKVLTRNEHKETAEKVERIL